MAYGTSAIANGGRNGRAMPGNFPPRADGAPTATRMMDSAKELTRAAGRLIGAAALALLVLASGRAVAQTPEALAAADRLIAVQKPVELMKDTAVSVAERLPGATEAQKQAFIREMTDPDFMARYQAQMRVAFSKHLTVEEMNALSDFYSKPIAISAMRKMGATMGELMTFIQSEIPAIVARIMKTP
jgi:hypothetical protein